MSRKLFKALRRNLLCVLTALALVVTNVLPVGVIGAAADDTAVTFKVTIEKQDIFGDHLPGAMLELTGVDPDGNVIGFSNDSIEVPEGGQLIRSGESLVWMTGNVPATVHLQQGTYTLHEMSAPENYTEASDITFNVNENGTVTRDGVTVDTIIMIDESAGDDNTETTKEPFSVSKTDISGTSEVPDAELAIYKAEDIVNGMPEEGALPIISWTSGNTPKKLTADEMAKFDEGDYYLVEVGAPTGYAYSESVMFTLILDEDNNTIRLSSGNTITMKDDAIEDIYISKTDVGGGDEVEGATLTVYLKEDVTITTDENGNETVTVKDGAKAVESWTSGTEAHKIEGSKLIADTTYVLVEESAPDGYAYTDSIEFTIEKDGSVSGDALKNGVITMEDEAIGDVNISKVAVGGGKEIGGAKLKITDSEDNEIDSWTSEDGKTHVIDGKKFKAGKTYTLTEVTAPAGYEIAENIEFTIENDGSVTVDGKKVDDRTIVMEDKPEDKPEEPSDKTVKVSKTDITGEKEIGGAKLTVTDKDGNVIDEWTSEEGKTHEIDSSKFKSGEKYTLTETGAPDGYAYTESIEFTFNEDGTVSGEAVNENGVIVMKDEAIGDVDISKVDMASGKEIAGATLTITDSEGNVIETWVSEENKTHTVPGSKFKAGETYTLTEVNAPDGYAYAESISFTIGKDGSVNGGDDRTIVMKDELLPVNDTPSDNTPSDNTPSGSTAPSISGNKRGTTSNVNNAGSTVSENVGAGAGAAESGENADNGNNNYAVVSVCIAAFIAAAFAVKRKSAR